MKGFRFMFMIQRNRVRIPLPSHRLQVCRFFNALDINLFREEKGHDPEKIRESQRRRFARVDLVDQVIEQDKQWLQRKCELEVDKLKIAKQDASEMIKQTEENNKATSQNETGVQEAKSTLDSLLGLFGNLIHDSVPISDDEANNTIVRTWGECRKEPNLKNHVGLVQLLGIVDFQKGVVGLTPN